LAIGEDRRKENVWNWNWSPSSVNIKFLQNVLSELLDDVPLLVRMDSNLENRWIDRDGPVLWPARSPDLNTCDFFLWGRLKQIMYETAVNTVKELTE
jgi:hypothetical protein